MNLKQIDEWIFMKSIRDDFTLLGKLTIFPIVFVVGWFMIICFLPLLPIVWLIDKLPNPKKRIDIDEMIYKLKKLFIRNLWRN